MRRQRCVYKDTDSLTVNSLGTCVLDQILSIFHGTKSTLLTEKMYSDPGL